MSITNHNLLKLRILSPIIATVFSVAVYAEVKEYFMFPFVFLQLVSIFIAIKFKCAENEKSLSVISKGWVVFLTALYMLAIAMGILVAIESTNIAHSIAAACFYVVCLDAIMAIPFLLSFVDKSKWNAYEISHDFGDDSSINSANGQAMTGYTDSSGCLPGCGTPSWPQDDYYSNTSDSYDPHSRYYN